MKQILRFVSLIIFVFILGFVLASRVSAQSIPPTVTYSGIVRNGDNVPVHNVKIVLVNTSAIDAKFTDSNGLFALHIPTGTYTLLIQGGDNVLTPILDISLNNIVVNSDTTQDITIPTQRLVLTVRDANGNPYPNATINIKATPLPYQIYSGSLQVGGSEIGNFGVTDSSGVISIPFLPSETVSLRVYPPPYTSPNFFTLTEPYPASGNLEVALPALYIYSGIFRNGDGVPIPGVQVLLRNGNAQDIASTANDGSFTLLVPVGSYDLRVYQSGDSPYTPSFDITQNNFVISDNKVQDLTIPVRRLTLTVNNTNGYPFLNARVTMNGLNSVPFSLYPGGTLMQRNTTNTGTTDSTGKISTLIFPSESLSLRVYPPPYQSPNFFTYIVPYPSSGMLVITLPDVFSFSGVFRNGENVPVPGIQISLIGSEAQNVSVTAADGSFLLHIPAGQYKLHAYTSGTSILVPQFDIYLENIDISGNTVQDLKLPTEKLVVTILDANGNPYPNATVNINARPLPYLLYPGSPYIQSEIGNTGVTDSSGNVVFSFLRSQTLTGRIYPPPYNPSHFFVFSEPYPDDGSVIIGLGQPPVLHADLEATINEGEIYIKDGYFEDQDSTSWSAVVDYGDGVGVQPLNLTGKNFSLNHIYQNNGSFPITLSITDSEGKTGSMSGIVIVNNVVPTVGPIDVSVTPVAINSSISFSASFTDLGVLDTHTAVWDWGDGTTIEGSVSETNGSGNVSGTHSYGQAGIYLVTLAVTDNSGSTGTNSYQYIAVYDPSAGFLTASGKYNSLPEMDIQHPEVSGEAKFGVQAKYTEGNAIPTGNMKFSLKEANIDFQSTAYQWLVISGSRATLKGTGALNGSGNYSFLFSGLDGGHPGNSNLVRFQIKDSNGTVVYDTQPGAGDGEDPITTLTSGLVKVH